MQFEEILFFTGEFGENLLYNQPFYYAFAETLSENRYLLSGLFRNTQR